MSGPEAGCFISGPLFFFPLPRRNVQKGQKNFSAVDQPQPSLVKENVLLFAVPRQAAGFREGLATGGAGVGAVTGMGALVSLQVARHPEVPAAGGAGVGAFAGMSAHVYRQVA